ncbi:vancomycin permeability regulator SanA [Kitasatospora gansuensis]|uniref:Vancomycin permeability regulator SanA n=1 Tax=Kitasatospora gansuensis TaxID=258050 RepID=A0A7W7SHY6_9ACTN|nr:ElyC/SanA/YdcF family protein [Kitasatospora gansuensis]MBB4950823.1 vancomycin permeability regulator SanA [Kitasatospora gansuensis]
MRRVVQRRLFQAAVAASAVALAPMTWLWLGAGDRVGTVAQAPSAPVAVVFGAGLFDGKPSPYLAHRLDAAVTLYQDHRVQAVLVTGDNSRTEYDETDAMHDYLVEHGVPAVRVVEDYAGFDTWDSCTRAQKVFGVERAVLISQTFHVRRALALCQAAGIDSYAVGVDEPTDSTWYYGGLREIPGAGKAALDALFEPDPTFLGEKEHGLGRALADAAH